MTLEVAFTGEANAIATDHLLQHYRVNVHQEDLCFALWRWSTGRTRRTALIYDVLLPEPKDRFLHGNASFSPGYLGRVVMAAYRQGAGLAFMHSHPSKGWQSMSPADVNAEQNVIAYPAMATGLPLVGLTIGTDGYWSARFWEKKKHEMQRQWCPKVRAVQRHRYGVYFHETLCPEPRRRSVLQRTFDSWGAEVQGILSRLHIGIVGVGSVGSIVAESMARIGVARITLIDPDIVETHNLDRLLNASTEDIGTEKVTVAKRAIERHATASRVDVMALPMSVHQEYAYKTALDCDVIFSCVDRPVARDTLNCIAYAHLIPVIDGGVAIEVDPRTHELFAAHWRAHMVVPPHQCMRCNGQYDTSMVTMELDGSLDDPSYISHLPREGKGMNLNVFPFSLAAAGMEVNILIRYLVAQDWWPEVRQQDHQFLTAENRIENAECYSGCAVRARVARGDLEQPAYISFTSTPLQKSWWSRAQRSVKAVGRRFWSALFPEP